MNAFGQFSRELISALPSELWAALGAFAVWALTVLTNRISNSHASQMLRDQLAHDSAERQREREYAIKRQVYLPAIEASAHATSLLAQLCHADIDRHNIEIGLADASTKVAAASAFASEETWLAMMKLQQAMGRLHSDLSANRGPIELEHLNLKYAREQAQIALQEQERANAEQRRAYGERGTNPEDLERATRVMAISRLYFDGMQQRQNETSNRLGQAMHESFKLYLDSLPLIGELSIACIVALRAELGMKTDPALMKESQQAMIAESRAEAQAVMARMAASWKENGSDDAKPVT
jgi:hypothetical protein